MNSWLQKLRERFTYSINQILAFVKNPTSHFVQANESYKQLFDIATIIHFVSLAFSLNDESELWIIIVLIILIIPLARIYAWLTLNVSGYIFNYLLTIIFKKLNIENLDYLTNQKIITYASVASVIAVLPIANIEYVSLISYCTLLFTGVKLNYNLSNRDAFISVGFYTIVTSIIIVSIAMIPLIVGSWTSSNVYRF